MNDELTPREHDEMRDSLLHGARMIKPAGTHRTQLLAGALALVLVGAIAGGSLAVAAQWGSADHPPVTSPSPTPTTSETRTPTPTPTPTADPGERPPASATGVVAFGGNCDNVLTAGELQTAMGSEMIPHEPAWHSGENGILGGLHCEWLTSDIYSGQIDVFAFPEAAVPAAVRDKARACGTEIDTCAVRVARDGTWIHVSGGPVSTERALESLAELIADRSLSFAPAAAYLRSSQWWESGSCEQLQAAVDFGAIAGWLPLSARPAVYEPGDSPWDVPELSGLRMCMFTGSTLSGHSVTDVSVRVIPGAAPFFAGIAAAEDSRPVVVEGAMEAVDARDDSLWEGHYRMTVATDGWNLVIVGDNAWDQESGRAQIAAAVIAGMNG